MKLPNTSVKEFIAIDVETTGLNPELESVLQVAAVKFNSNGKIIEQYEKLFRPHKGYILPQVTKIHGITYEKVKDENTYNETSSRELKDFCDGYELVGHNLKFDLSFLDFKFLNIPKQHDTLIIAREKWPGKKNNLKACCSRIELPIVSYHDAMNDTIQTMRLFLFLRYTDSEQISMAIEGKVYKEEEAGVKSQAINNIDKSIIALDNKEIKKNINPHFKNGDLVIPFESPIENHWWKKDAKSSKIIDRKIVEIFHHRTKVKIGEKEENVIEWYKTYPDVNFKKLSEIIASAESPYPDKSSG